MKAAALPRHRFPAAVWFLACNEGAERSTIYGMASILAAGSLFAGAVSQARNFEGVGDHHFFTVLHLAAAVVFALGTHLSPECRTDAAEA